jgi:hypothetical protein
MSPDEGIPMKLAFWFDPACPWTWNTSRWITEVAEQRPEVEVDWRSFSLKIKNADVDLPDSIVPRITASHRLLRVVEAVRAAGHSDRIGALYTELGRRIHHQGELDFDVAEVLAAVGLPVELAGAADDESRDPVIEASMREALDMAGDDVGVPIIRFPGGDRPIGFFGPILVEVPTGDEALKLFDVVEAAAGLPAFTELKRARTSGPVLPAEPVAAAG